MEVSGRRFEWADVKQDLKSLQVITLEEDGKRLAIRTQCQGTCGKVFQAVGVATPQQSVTSPANRSHPNGTAL
jgi:hypothetical protein